MTRPDDIPQDVWDAAVDVIAIVEAMPSEGNISAVARAILDERERCAMIADLSSVYGPYGSRDNSEVLSLPGYRYAVAIADRIRDQ